jgi:hypothetical protein
MYSFG